MVKLDKMLQAVRPGRRNPPAVAPRAVIDKGSRAAANRLPAEDNLSALAGSPGQGWARTEYGR